MTDATGTRAAYRTFLVCGSRGYTSALNIRDALTDYGIEGTRIIHGGARGADRLAGFEAEDLGYIVEAMPPRYDEGETPLDRNKRMLDEKPELVIAFWDGKSTGTLHTIRHAVQCGIPVRIVP